MSIFRVYELVDPRSNNPFYVGFSGSKRSNGESRPLDHFREATSGKFRNNIKCGIINQIVSEGMKPEIRWVFSSDSSEEALAEEVRLISKYGRIHLGTGILSNLTPGGESFSETVRSYVYTEEHREKIRQSNRSRVVSQETKAKISKAAREGTYNKQPKSDDFKARVSATKLKRSAEKKAQSPKYNWIHDEYGQIIASRHELIEQYKGLEIGELGHVIRGKYRQHKGWRLDQ